MKRAAEDTDGRKPKASRLDAPTIDPNIPKFSSRMKTFLMDVVDDMKKNPTAMVHAHSRVKVDGESLAEFDVYYNRVKQDVAGVKQAAMEKKATAGKNKKVRTKRSKAYWPYELKGIQDVLITDAEGKGKREISKVRAEYKAAHGEDLEKTTKLKNRFALHPDSKRLLQKKGNTRYCVGMGLTTMMLAVCVLQASKRDDVTLAQLNTCLTQNFFLNGKLTRYIKADHDDIIVDDMTVASDASGDSYSSRSSGSSVESAFAVPTDISFGGVPDDDDMTVDSMDLTVFDAYKDGNTVVLQGSEEEVAELKKQVERLTKLLEKHKLQLEAHSKMIGNLTPAKTGASSHALSSTEDQLDAIPEAARDWESPPAENTDG